jgi:hypothetical protein
MIASLFDGIYDQASAILDVIAVASIAGAAFLYSRVKAALLVSESAGKSWHEEAEAQRNRADRNATDLKESEQAKLKLLATVAALEARPDLSKLEALVAESTESMKRHELSAADRTDRLIAAVESIRPQAA